MNDNESSVAVLERPQTKEQTITQEIPNVGEQFTQLLTEVQDILESRPPERWMFSIYRKLTYIRRHPDKYAPEVQKFIEDYADNALGVLLEQRKMGIVPHGPVAERRNVISENSLDVIHQLAEVIDSEKEEEPSNSEVHNISLEEVIGSSDRFRTSEKKYEDNTTLTIFEVYSKQTATWHKFPLPPTGNILHKGGFPRVVLKILQGAPEETIESELPPNDFDVVTHGDRNEIYPIAKKIGVDLQGVETVDNFDFKQLCESRDIDLNGCFMGSEGIIFSSDAAEAAKTGKVHIKGNNRGIYGSEKFMYDRCQLVKNRGLMRLFKVVAEGKAVSFEINPLNKQIDLGIYWLVLARKFSKKPNAPELLDKLFYLGKQTDQVHNDEASIYDVLDRVHAENTFFDFNEAELDAPGVAMWLNRKLMRLVNTKFRKEHNIPSNLQLERNIGDNIPMEVSLENYTGTEEDNETTKAKWDAFVNRCRLRKEAEGNNSKPLFPK